MNQPFYALIIPQTGPGVPTHPISPGGQPGQPTHPIYNPPYPSQGPGFPTHPIAPGGPPLGIWGGGNMPYPDQGLPGYQPYPGQGLPGNQPYPGQGLPGNQPYPGQGLPGNQPYPGQGLPPPPLGIWGGRPPAYVDIGGPGAQPMPGWGPGFPTNPIVIPPGDLPDHEVGDDEMVIVIFVPGIGYKLAVVPKPETPPGYNPPTGPSTERPQPVDKK